jgi:hypothetical protein
MSTTAAPDAARDDAPPPDGTLTPTQPGDVVDAFEVAEPAVTVDMLTSHQLRTLLTGQLRMRAIAEVAQPTTPERAQLLAAVQQIRMLARVVELALAGHLLVDVDGPSGMALKFCRGFVAPTAHPENEADEQERPAPTLLGPDGLPAVRNGPGLFVPGE